MNLSLSFLLFSFFSLLYFSVKGNNTIEKITQEIENAPSEHEQINIIDKTLDSIHDFPKKSCNAIESIKEKFDEKNPKHAFALSYIYYLLSIHCTTEKKPAHYQKAIDFIRKTKVPCYEEYYKVSYEIYYYSGTLQIKQEDVKEKIKETFNQAYLNLEKKGCAAYFYLIAYREATASNFQENMSESLSNLLKSIDYYEKYTKDNYPKMPHFYFVLYDMGGIYYNLKDYPKSLKYWLECLKLIEENNIRNRITINLQNSIGLSYMKGGHYENAPYYYEKAIELARELKDSVWIGIPQGNLAELLLREGKFTQAEKHLKEYLDYAITYKEHGIVTIAYIKMGYSKQLQKKWHESLEYFKKAEDYLNQYRDIIRATLLFKYLEYNVLLYNRYITSLSSLQEYERAFYYSQKKQIYLDSLNQLINQQQIEELEAKYKLKEQERENLLLKAQLKNQEDELKIGKLFTVITVILIIGSFISGFFILRYVNIKRKYIHQLENLNKVKDKLFSVVSHDLRSFIANLRNFVMLVSEHDLKKEEYEIIIEELSKSTEETSIMMDNLLLWAKSQLQGFRLQYKIFPLQDLFSKSFAELRWMAEKKKITLEAEILPPIKTIFADAMMLEIILRNFLTNAIKFSQYNSRVSVKVSINQENYIFEVRDSGVGMTKEQLAQIQNGTIQSKRGTQDEKGVGLGLMICREAIAEMGGDFWVESQIGKGTSVFFSIPIKNQEILKIKETITQPTNIQNS